MRSMSASAPMSAPRSSSTTACSPWLGMLAGMAIAGAGRQRHRARSASASASAASISRCSPSPSPSSPASCSTISPGSAARAACSCRSPTARSNDLLHLRGSPAMFYYLLLALTLAVARAQPRRCCAGASATTGRRSARTRRRREALGIDVFRYKLAAVALSAAMTAIAGAVLAFYDNNLYPDTTFATRARSRSSPRRSSAGSAPCSARSSAPSC